MKFDRLARLGQLGKFSAEIDSLLPPRGLGLFQRLKPTNVNRSSVVADLSHIAVSEKTNAADTCRAWSMGAVSRVLYRACQSKIAEPVVRHVPVNVVNYPNGPPAGHVKPRESMRFVVVSLNDDLPSVLPSVVNVRTASNVSSLHATSAVNPPSKHTSGCVVVEQFQQSCVADEYLRIAHVMPIACLSKGVTN